MAHCRPPQLFEALTFHKAAVINFYHGNIIEKSLGLHLFDFGIIAGS